jgi:glycosyltransferase involved in cell wall biosynthesis
MRLLLLPKYGPKGASSRYRLWQYVPLLEQLGHTVEVRPLADDEYLEILYSSGARKSSALLINYLRRIVDVVVAKDFDAVICEQELLPYVPYWLERVFYRGSRRLYVDYDDAAYVKYVESFFLRRKIQRIMAAATAVIVGNRALAGYASDFARRVIVIPTVVDVSRYPDRQQRPAEKTVRIVWIGTPLTASFLEPVLPVWHTLKKRYPNLQLRLIGAGSDLASKAEGSELREWSRETEAVLLSDSDIGIMPLPDTEFTRGKCGLKLIQYMAAGLPVVASTVGANCTIVRDGVNGFLVNDVRQWAECLSELIDNPQLRMRMGYQSRAIAVAEYSIEQGLKQWLSVFEHDGINVVGAAEESAPQLSARQDTGHVDERARV